jgi:hypothetical protein
MDRTQAANYVDIGGGKRGFRDRNLGTGVRGTTHAAADRNAVQESIVLAIEAAGLTPDANDWTLLTQAIRRLGPVSTLLALTATQAIADTTEAAVTWPAEVMDTANAFLLGAPTRITVPSGFTQAKVTAQVTFSSNATGSRKARILKNGAGEGIGLPAVRFPAAGAADVTVLPMAGAAVPVTAGDYFQLMVQQDSGGSLNLVAVNTWLAVEFYR